MEHLQHAKTYYLAIDGPLFRMQRALLLRLLMDKQPLVDDEHELLQGLVCLLDEIADQAHDVHGLDCLLLEDTNQCTL